MSVTHNEPSKRTRPWQSQVWVQLLAVVLGVLTLYSGLIILQLRSELKLSIQAFFIYLAVISPLAIVIVFLLLRFLCGENPRDLNLKAGKLASDALATLILTIVIIVASVISTYFLTEVLPESPSNTSVTNLFSELAGNPGLLALFAGPLFLLGATSEEVVRVFFLSRLWKVWPARIGKLVTVIISACLFGLIHMYQGPINASWTVIFGLIMGLYYLRFGRVVPLILAHYLTNSIQVLIFAMLT
jgi:membrane protease YdiL (CAAX protease family)